MCQRCVDALKRVFPNASEKEGGEILMSFTAFPFGGPGEVERQLHTARKAFTQGRKLCMYCGRARAPKYMDWDMCKKPCAGKWNNREGLQAKREVKEAQKRERKATTEKPGQV